MTTKNLKPLDPKGLRNGFALVVTLSLMILLTIIAVGLLTLSSITLRASGIGSDQQQARSNARLALMLAIGDLQLSLGPDTRVSANAKVMEKQGVNIKDNLEQIAGAWDSWRPTPTNIGDYEQKKKAAASNEILTGPDGLPQPMGGFRTWLFSTADPMQARDIDYPKSGTLSNPVELVTPPDNNQPGVEVSKIALRGAGNKLSGRVAWAVFDEGQKAAANLGQPSATGTSLEQLANQTKPHFKNIPDWAALATIADVDRTKLQTYSTTKLAGNLEKGNFSHDLTSGSTGVLSDVTLGKLRTDLSLLFKDSSLPSTYSSRHIYSGTNTPVTPAPGRGSHPHAWPSPDPKWKLLHEYCRIPATYGFDKTGDNANIRIDFNKIPNRLTTPSSGLPAAVPAYNEVLKLSPVISKAQFFFSLTFCKDGTLSKFWQESGGTANQRGTSPFYAQADVIIDPVITLWNPYDIPIQVPEFRLFLYRLPLQFAFDTTNPKFRKKSGFSGFTDYVDLVKPAGNTPTLAYPFRILPAEGSNTINMNPGEHIVCSVQSFSNSAGIVDGKDTGDLIMRPGWYPPNSGAKLKTGGISSENLFRDENGKEGAEFLGSSGNWLSTRALPVSQGDKISITVKPSVANRGQFATLGSQPVDFYLRYAKPGSLVGGGGRERVDHADFGAIELEYGPKLSSYLKTFSSKAGGAQALPVFPILASDITNAPVDASFSVPDSTGQVRAVKLKKPFLVATLHMKSLTTDAYRSQFPSKAWIYNNPTAIYASNGLGNQIESPASHQYDFSLEPLTGSWKNGVPEVNGTRFNGYGGPSSSASDGRAYAPFVSLPRVRPTSLAQLRHAPLNQSGKLPLQAQVLANSFAHPLLNPDTVLDAGKGYLDHSFLANSLFDRTFFSSANNGQEILDLAEGSKSLVNPRMVPYPNPNQNLVAGSEGYDHSAASLMVDGAFNVNSTSVKAWTAFLTAMNGKEIPQLPALNVNRTSTISNQGEVPHTSRYLLPLDQGLGDSLDPSGATAETAWSGYRKLETPQIEVLAKAIVEEVKSRGPFQSMAEFINRRAENSELGQMGALQAAIEKSGINKIPENDSKGLFLTGTEPGSEDFRNQEAAKGSSLAGTPGYLLQADLLNSMATVISVRSDTFRIRGYGEATDTAGRVTATAICEAVLQRVPDYVDQINSASDHLGTDSTEALSKVNKTFGRRFQIISFRWLTQQEI